MDVSIRNNKATSNVTISMFAIVVKINNFQEKDQLKCACIRLDFICSVKLMGIRCCSDCLKTKHFCISFFKTFCQRCNLNSLLASRYVVWNWDCNKKTSWNWKLLTQCCYWALSVGTCYMIDFLQLFVSALSPNYCLS